MKKLVTGILVAFLACVASVAQSAQKIADICDTAEANYGQVCYLIGTNSQLIDDQCSEEESFATIRKSAVFSSEKTAQDSITMSDLAFLCSRTWNISESLLYKLTKSPRYAFKQLQALDIIPSNAYPDSKVTGTQLLDIITMCIDYSEK